MMGLAPIIRIQSLPNSLLYFALACGLHTVSALSWPYNSEFGRDCIVHNQLYGTTICMVQKLIYDVQDYNAERLMATPLILQLILIWTVVSWFNRTWEVALNPYVCFYFPLIEPQKRQETKYLLCRKLRKCTQKCNVHNIVHTVR